MISVAHIQMDINFRSPFYDISQILIALEVLISTCTKNDKNANSKKNVQ